MNSWIHLGSGFREFIKSFLNFNRVDQFEEYILKSSYCREKKKILFIKVKRRPSLRACL